MKDFCHRGACDVCAFTRKATFSEVTACVLAVGHVHIGNDVDYTAVGLFREAFVLASVSGFHVENRDMKPFGAYDAQAAVGVSENEDCVWLRSDKEFVAAVDYISAGGTEVIPYCIHIDLGSIELEILEEDSVQVVVIVLSCMCQDYIEVFAAFVDDGRQTDNFRACADYDYEFKSAVILEFYI